MVSSSGTCSSCSTGLCPDRDVCALPPACSCDEMVSESGGYSVVICRLAPCGSMAAMSESSGARRGIPRDAIRSRRRF